jgi:hypothetical protein
LEIVALARLLVFVSVTDSVDVVFAWTVPNDKVDGLAVSVAVLPEPPEPPEPPETPEPRRLRYELRLKLAQAPTLPEVVGVNTTENETLCPAATVSGKEGWLTI